MAKKVPLQLVAPSEISEIEAINDKLVQLEQALQLQSVINGKLIENMNAVLLAMAEMRAELNNNKNGSRIILPPSNLNN